MTPLELYQKRLQTERIPQSLITDPVSIHYLIHQFFDVGERFIALCLYADRPPVLLLNKLFTPNPDPDFTLQVINDADAVIDRLTQVLQDGELAVDGHMESRYLLDLQATQRYHCFNGSWLIDRQRAIKSPAEQEMMRIASRKNDTIMGKVRAYIHEGMSEQELAARIMEWQAEDGLSGCSFEPIVSINANIADPHATPTDKKLQPKDTLVVDMGGIYQGFNSDMTRTFYFRTAPEPLYEICLRANLAGIAAVKPGATFADVDGAARQVIEDAGYGAYFVHRTGHGIGQSVHEPYDVSASNHAKIEPGMIFSIEPGIYLPGQTGVRIEDLVIATETGVEVLNDYPKDNPVIQ